MKITGMLSVVAMVLFGWTNSYAQDLDAEVPGDHFSLEGALELFKKSESPEQFEKLLNSPDSKVNNLDLDGDGYIDYIRVLDRQERNVHVFVMQAVLPNDEFQDIARIELEKLANGKAVLQIIGDPDIYGIETIIEPTSEVRTYGGTMSTSTVVNVWAWPSVQYVYSPYYVTYVSPWGWYTRPVWWRSWRPIAYVHYYPIWSPYRHYYSYCPTRRVVYAYDMYYPHRRTSVIVYNRHHHRVTQYRERYADAGYGRTRDDRGRGRGRDDGDTGGRQGRESNERNGRSSSERESVSLPTRERTQPADFQRRSAELNRERNTGSTTESNALPRSNRRSVETGNDVTPSTGRRRGEATSAQPSINREQQRSVNRERSAPQINRSSRETQVQPSRESRSVNTESRPQINRSTSNERSGSINSSGHSSRSSRSLNSGGNSRSSGSLNSGSQRTIDRSSGSGGGKSSGSGNGRTRGRD